MEKKYKSLRFMGGLYKVLAYIALIATILFIVGADIAMVAGSGYISDMVGMDLGGMEFIGAILFTLGGLFFGGLIFISLLAIGEAVSLMISVEESTRYTALILRDRPQ
jgi:hypothetical protein